ncbi:MAG TPA: hypothetical protein DCZ23_01955 [Lachnospiraceae bacterium]|nr:hypothetical protein [Lachnospiraceae bacterium]
MKQIRYIWTCTQMKIVNSRMAAFALLMFFLAWNYNMPVRRFVQEMDYPVSWCVFPFILTASTYLFVFWFGVIYVNSDIPFLQHAGMYQIMRTGRRVWVVGQIGAVIVRSITIVCIAALCTVISLFPRIEFTNDWGKLLRTMALPGEVNRLAFRYDIYYDALVEYTPVQLMMLTLLIGILASAFMGILMFLICLYTNKVTAVVVTSAFVILYRDFM